MTPLPRSILEFRDKLANAWDRGPDGHAGFLSGFDACFTHLTEMAGKEWDKQKAIEQAKHEDSDGYFGFLTGAEWQHALDQAALLKEREENEALKVELEKEKRSARSFYLLEELAKLKKENERLKHELSLR